MSFSGFMNMPMTVYNSSGTDKFDQPAFGSGTAINARFRQTNSTLIVGANEVEPIDGVVITDPSVTVNIGDKIVYNSVNYRVLTKLISVDGRGDPHHFELKVQEWNI